MSTGLEACYSVNFNLSTSCFLSSSSIFLYLSYSSILAASSAFLAASCSALLFSSSSSLSQLSASCASLLASSFLFLDSSSSGFSYSSSRFPPLVVIFFLNILLNAVIFSAFQKIDSSLSQWLVYSNCTFASLQCSATLFRESFLWKFISPIILQIHLLS